MKNNINNQKEIMMFATFSQIESKIGRRNRNLIGGLKIMRKFIAGIVLRLGIAHVKILKNDL